MAGFSSHVPGTFSWVELATTERHPEDRPLRDPPDPQGAMFAVFKFAGL